MVMIVAMIADFRTFNIPNSLPLILMLAYPLAALSAGFSWQQILWTFALGSLVLLVAVAMFVMKIMGGGDGKLLAAATLWTGQERLLEFLLLTALAGGILALSLLLYRRLPLANALSGMAALRQMHENKQDVPYAIAIGIAGLLAYPLLPILNV
jgi:prepilin peptidase CpaA